MAHGPTALMGYVNLAALGMGLCGDVVAASWSNYVDISVPLGFFIIFRRWDLALASALGTPPLPVRDLKGTI